MECKKEFSIPYGKVKELGRMENAGLVIGCRQCEAKNSAIRMIQCPKCKEYFVRQTGKVLYTAMKAGEDVDIRDIPEICPKPNCKTDVFEFLHQRMRQAGEGTTR